MAWALDKIETEVNVQENEITQVWAEEAARRDQDMESGEEPGIPAEEVLQRLRSSLQ
jgi:hypothetical protein